MSNYDSIKAKMRAKQDGKKRKDYTCTGYIVMENQLVTYTEIVNFKGDDDKDIEYSIIGVTDDDGTVMYFKVKDEDITQDIKAKNIVKDNRYTIGLLYQVVNNIKNSSVNVIYMEKVQ